MKFGLFAAVCAWALAAAQAGEFTSALAGRVTYTDSDGWSVAVDAKTIETGVEEWRFSFAADKPTDPPKTTIECTFPLKDTVGRWTTGAGLRKHLPVNWAGGFSSALYSQAPVLAYFSDSNENRGVIACSEAFRRVTFNMGVIEETAQSCFAATLFSEPEAPISSYEVSFRLDFRPVFYADALRAAFAWYGTMPACKPAAVPAAAFDPLYSFWYSYHQDVTAPSVEKECAAAVPYGMKTAIVDDGWQTDDTNRGYSYCGDWQVSTNRFPDFAAHVKKVHELGMKYMIWYGVPMIGFKSRNHDRFKGKYLWSDSGRWSDFSCLDPRFPEVREFLCGVYEKAMRDWDLDGLKLDFIDAFGFNGPDPAVAEDYAGRDIKSLSEAIDRLMKDVHARLTAVKPEALIEFRQCYIGPGIRQYGNMLRATDCPGDLQANRCRIANLRLTSGETAVHADMLEWNVAETAENAARFVLSSVFGVIQYSVMLRELPADHKRMIAHWLDFTRRHRETLLKGAFRPHHYEAFYPVIEAESAAERIVAVYNDAAIADGGKVDRPIYILNATGSRRMAVLLSGGPATGEIFDTFGVRRGVVALRAGLQEVAVPVSGYVRIAPDL